MITDPNTSLLRWVEGAFPPGEFLAVGGAFADGKFFHLTATREFSACMDDGPWLVLAETMKRLEAEGTDGRLAMWAFENALLWISTRKDGAWIGIFTARDLPDETRALIRARMQDFRTL